jgi:hypothetical protein
VLLRASPRGWFDQYDRPSSPQPPSARCFDKSQATALRIIGSDLAIPAALSAISADHVP